MFVTGDAQIDQQIEHAVNTHKLSLDVAKLCVLAGMPEEHIANAAQYADPFVYIKAWQMVAYPPLTMERIANIISLLPNQE